VSGRTTRKLCRTPFEGSCCHIQSLGSRSMGTGRLGLAIGDIMGICPAARSFNLVCEEYKVCSSGGGQGYSSPQHKLSRGIETTARSFVCQYVSNRNDNEDSDPLDEDFTNVEVCLCYDSHGGGHKFATKITRTQLWLVKERKKSLS
jgi:hypothetical protein